MSTTPRLHPLGKPCWRVRGIPYGSRKLIYKDKEKTPNGIIKISMKPGDTGKAKAAVGAKGDTLIDPPLPFGTTTRVQLHASTGACWEATFSGSVLRNDATQFNALSD